MTLVVGIKARSGLVIASDSRVTGLSHYDGYTKVRIISGRFCLATFGSGQYTGRIIAESNTALNAMTTVEAGAHILCAASRQIISSWSDADKAANIFGFVIGGPSIGGSQEIYGIQTNLQNGEPQHQQSFNGFGSPLSAAAANAVFSQLYGPELSLDRLQKLASFAIVESSRHDVNVGPPLQIGFSGGTSFAILSPSQSAVLEGWGRTKGDFFRSNFWSGSDGPPQNQS